jgi:hypothetical protein
MTVKVNIHLAWDCREVNDEIDLADTDTDEEIAEAVEDYVLQDFNYGYDEDSREAWCDHSCNCQDYREDWSDEEPSEDEIRDWALQQIDWSYERVD